MMLEVIATCIGDVQAIVAGGGDRIELVSGLSEGGLTPSTALMRRTLETKIPVFVMVRPHAQSFVYSKDDISLMREDILNIRRLGAAGVVLGCLTESGQVDEVGLASLLEVVGPLPVTFHRAFDHTPDLAASLEVLKQFPQIKRVLTSGGAGSAGENISTLTALAAQAGPEMMILPGGGVCADSIPSLLQIPGITEVHMGTAVRHNSSCLEAIDAKALEHCIALSRKAA